MVGDRNLLLRAARTQRREREGELISGLTKHGRRIVQGILGSTGCLPA